MTGWVIAQAGIGFVWLFVGYVLGRSRAKATTPEAPPPAKPICMCTHIYGSHEDGHRCKTAIFDKDNFRLGDCACRLYVGPDPLTSGFWHPSVKEKEKA